MRIKIGGYSINFSNVIETFSIYKDIFLLRQYKFKSERKNPFIIDCGSHIGLSVLYFKKIYPESHILSFEANPKTAETLEKNISQNFLKNVTLIKKAVGLKKGKIPYYVATQKNGWNWGDAGVKNDWYNVLDYETIYVPSTKLSEYINRSVDLLKIDIEGMEMIVLSEIKHKLKFVQEIIMEFHGGKKNKKNRLENVVALLKECGFSFSIKYPSTILNPFRKEVEVADVKNLNSYFLIIHAKKI